MLMISEEPQFEELKELGFIKPTTSARLFNSPYDHVLNYLNNLSPVEGFIYRHYSPEGTRNDDTIRSYFTGRNAAKVDVIRGQIEKWFCADRITHDEYCLLLADLLRAVAAVSNTAGTYGFYLKKLEPRAMKELELKRSRIVPGNTDHSVFNKDANKLVAEIAPDIAYLDPPYNWRQYAAYYHILETVACNDTPRLQGKSGLRPWQTQRSLYSDRKAASRVLAEITSTIRAESLILSYNADGLVSHDEIMSILQAVGEPEFRTVILPRYTSSSGGSDNHHVEERLYYVDLRK